MLIAAYCFVCTAGLVQAHSSIWVIDREWVAVYGCRQGFSWPTMNRTRTAGQLSDRCGKDTQSNPSLRGFSISGRVSSGQTHVDESQVRCVRFAGQSHLFREAISGRKDGRQGRASALWLFEEVSDHGFGLAGAIGQQLP